MSDSIYMRMIRLKSRKAMSCASCPEQWITIGRLITAQIKTLVLTRQWLSSMDDYHLEYLPAKPAKYGIKVWMRANLTYGNTMIFKYTLDVSGVIWKLILVLGSWTIWLVSCEVLTTLWMWTVFHKLSVVWRSIWTADLLKTV